MGPRPIGRGKRTGCSARSRRLVGCFNGAATDWSRKVDIGSAPQRARAAASMGPRPIGRGNDSQRLTGTRQRAIGFNGAATDWSRKASADRATVECLVPTRLQWGRDRSVAEMRPRRRSSLDAARSLQWGRDRLVAEMSVSRSTASGSRGFNGAATDRSRKVDPRAVSAAQWPTASMGPRPISRGNAVDRRIRPLASPTQASMGPRLIRSRNSCASSRHAMSFNGAATDRSRKRLRRSRCASMGPRPIGRGNSLPHNHPSFNDLHGVCERRARRLRRSASVHAQLRAGQAV